jgi:hypothetical protein
MEIQASPLVRVDIQRRGKQGGDGAFKHGVILSVYNLFCWLRVAR